MIDTAKINGKKTANEEKQLNLLEWLPVAGVLILVALVYAPVICNAFNGDDFVHLSWLSRAVNQPELLWRNFHSPWLDITTAKFYRPLISIFLLADYVFWQHNGAGFHLTNLLSHLGNTYLVWLILRHLAVLDNGKNINHIWCLSAAALFGLYPLHPESVSWITGRVDVFVTLFSLASIFCYMRRRLYFSFIFMALALLCKEMAIILPAVFCAYEFTFAYKQLNIPEDKTNQNIWLYLLSVVKITGPFWILLILYFGLRYYALGTFVGGYDNSLFAFDNLRGLLSTWRRSFYFLFFPFNEAILGKYSPVIFLWAFLLLVNLLLIVKQLFGEKKNVATFIFLTSWLILDLLPIYKLLNISADLQGSRLVYLATGPLCALLCLGYAGVLESGNKVKYWKMGALIVMLSAAGAGLLVNNSAWVKAEAASQAIVSELNILSKTKVSDSVVYIVGLPDQIDGAYVCRNALDGMSKYPQISKDIRYCFNLDEINHVFPFGYARRSMIDSKYGNQISAFYVWDKEAQKLKRFDPTKIQSFCNQEAPSLPANQPQNIWSGKDLAKVVSVCGRIFCPKVGSSVTYFDSSGALYVKSALSPDDRGEALWLRLDGRSCFDMDCLIVTIDFIGVNASAVAKPAFTLFYQNDLCPDFAGVDSTHKLVWHCSSEATEQQAIFPLYGQADWAMGGKCRGLLLNLPKCGEYKIKSVAIERADKHMPLLTFQPNANQNSLGFIELNVSHSFCRLNYNGSKVVGAKKLALEITAPDKMFAVPNDSGMPKLPLFKNLDGLTGLVSLKRTDFASPGIYGLRLRAFTSDDKNVGVAGDHVVVTVK